MKQWKPEELDVSKKMLKAIRSNDLDAFVKAYLKGATCKGMLEVLSRASKDATLEKVIDLDKNLDYVQQYHPSDKYSISRFVRWMALKEQAAGYQDVILGAGCVAGQVLAEAENKVVYRDMAAELPKNPLELALKAEEHRIAEALFKNGYQVPNIAKFISAYFNPENKKMAAVLVRMPLDKLPISQKATIFKTFCATQSLSEETILLYRRIEESEKKIDNRFMHRVESDVEDHYYWATDLIRTPGIGALRFFVEKGLVKLDAQGESGKTVLMRAIEYLSMSRSEKQISDARSKVMFILNQDPDMSLRDANGQTALDYAGELKNNDFNRELYNEVNWMTEAQIQRKKLYKHNCRFVVPECKQNG